MDLAVPTYFNFAHDVMEHWAAVRPDGLALWWLDDTGTEERKFTFAQMADEFRRVATFYASLGIKRGDRVLVILPRIPQWWTAMLGLVRLGAVPIPGPTLLTTRDVTYRLEAASVSAIITDAAGSEKVESSFKGIRLLVDSQREGWVDFNQGVKNADTSFEPEPTRSDDPGILYFTSGTSGPPKMALHTQASYGLAHRITGELWLDLQPGDVHWALADTGWGKTAWSSFYGPWHMGACVFTMAMHGKFHANVVLKTLTRFPITTFCAPPTALRMLVHEDLSRYKFMALKHCVAAGESLNADIFKKWKDATGLTIHEGYGQTETVLLIANFRSLGHPVRPGSMGVASPMFELAVLDENLHPMPAGEPGELAVKVNPVRPMGLFKEYWRDPVGTASRFRGDWYFTGDVARRDADGYFWFVGRADDVINSASYRIGPYEVETILADHPAIADVAVVAAPDALRSEVVKAYIVLRPGFVAGDALKRDIQDFCKRTTAPYKYPRQIEFLPELPRTINGKIRRAELRLRAAATAAAQAKMAIKP